MFSRFGKHPGQKNALTAILGVVGLGIVAFAGSLFQVSFSTTPTLPGIDIFAAFYIVAQLSERLTEVFSDVVADGSAKEVDEWKEKIDLDRSRIASAITADATADVDKWQNEIDDLEKKSRYAGNWRAIALWIVASLIGVLFTSLTLGFFQLIGLTWIPHNLDAFLSGIIIGGGTKPLHDFISYIAKQKG